MEKKALEFKVKVDEKALFRFQIYSVYHNMQGISALIISFLCIAYLIYGWGRLNVGFRLLFIFLGLFYLTFKPFELWVKSKLVSKQEAFNEPLFFTCEDDKITIRQGEKQDELLWGNIWKIVVRKQDIYVYTGKLYAYTITKVQTKDKWKKFIAMAEEKGCRIV